MNIKGYVVTVIICLIVIGLYIFDVSSSENKNANNLFKIYLRGEVLGFIDSEDELYNLINEEQKEIKSTYGVDNVYPPSDIEIVPLNTYNTDVTSVNDVYKKIEDADDFTIKGYTITVKTPSSSDEEEPKTLVINVLDKEIFDDAIHNFVTAFIDETLYNNYINGTQEEIVEYGEYIDAMYFLENISIQESYISVNDIIYTDVNELSQYLLFGPDRILNSYEVVQGDTIASIAEANKLNTKEFLVANPEYRDPDTLLSIGSEVNVTLLDPVLNFTYDVRKIDEVEIDYQSKTEVDNSKSVGYSEVTTDGVTGLQKVTQVYQVTNGLQSKELEIIEEETVVIREVVDKVTVVGPSYSGGAGTTSMQYYVYTGISFSLPTNPGAIVTSPFNEWRDGYAHKGTDFSGTGHNSPIYAIADGTVEYAGWGSGGQGNYIIINHGNGYYSTYLHMVTGSLKVSAGDTVYGGQHIGGMGNTGWSFGTHLHLEFTQGKPYSGQHVTYYDPYRILYGG